MFTAVFDVVSYRRIDEVIEQAKENDSQLFSQLLLALKHKDKSVVIGAGLLLGRVRDPRAVPSLIRAFLTPDEKVGIAIAWALGQCGSRLAQPFLMTAIQSGFAVSGACEALGHIGDEEALPTLFLVMDSKEEEVRLCVAKALGRHLERCSVSVRNEIKTKLTKLSFDQSRKVRICAQSALACKCDYNEPEQ